MPDPERSEHLDYLLTAYLFDSLSPAGVAEVNRHLETCAECRQELVELKETLALANTALDSGGKDYRFDERRRKRVIEGMKAAQRRPLVLKIASGRSGWWWFKVSSVAMLGIGVLLALAIRPQSSSTAKSERMYEVEKGKSVEFLGRQQKLETNLNQQAVGSTAANQTVTLSGVSAPNASFMSNGSLNGGSDLRYVAPSGPLAGGTTFSGALPQGPLNVGDTSVAVPPDVAANLAKLNANYTGQLGGTVPSSSEGRKDVAIAAKDDTIRRDEVAVKEAEMQRDERNFDAYKILSLKESGKNKGGGASSEATSVAQASGKQGAIRETEKEGSNQTEFKEGFISNGARHYIAKKAPENTAGGKPVDKGLERYYGDIDADKSVANGIAPEQKKAAEERITALAAEAERDKLNEQLAQQNTSISEHTHRQKLMKDRVESEDVRGRVAQLTQEVNELDGLVKNMPSKTVTVEPQKNETAGLPLAFNLQTPATVSPPKPSASPAGPEVAFGFDTTKGISRSMKGSVGPGLESFNGGVARGDEQPAVQFKDAGKVTREMLRDLDGVGDLTGKLNVNAGDKLGEALDKLTDNLSVSVPEKSGKPSASLGIVNKSEPASGGFGAEVPKVATIVNGNAPTLTLQGSITAGTFLNTETRRAPIPSAGAGGVIDQIIAQDNKRLWGFSVPTPSAAPGVTVHDPHGAFVDELGAAANRQTDQRQGSVAPPAKPNSLAFDLPPTTRDSQRGSSVAVESERIPDDARKDVNSHLKEYKALDTLPEPLVPEQYRVEAKGDVFKREDQGVEKAMKAGGATGGFNYGGETAVRGGDLKLKLEGSDAASPALGFSESQIQRGRKAGVGTELSDSDTDGQLPGVSWVAPNPADKDNKAAKNGYLRGFQYNRAAEAENAPTTLSMTPGGGSGPITSTLSNSTTKPMEVVGAPTTTPPVIANPNIALGSMGNAAQPEAKGKLSAGGLVQAWEEKAPVAGKKVLQDSIKVVPDVVAGTVSPAPKFLGEVDQKLGDLRTEGVALQTDSAKQQLDLGRQFRGLDRAAPKAETTDFFKREPQAAQSTEQLTRRLSLEIEAPIALDLKAAENDYSDIEHRRRRLTVDQQQTLAENEETARQKERALEAMSKVSEIELRQTLRDEKESKLQGLGAGPAGGGGGRLGGSRGFNAKDATDLALPALGTVPAFGRLYSKSVADGETSKSTNTPDAPASLQGSLFANGGGLGQSLPYPGIVTGPQSVQNGSLSEVGAVINHSIQFFPQSPDTNSALQMDKEGKAKLQGLDPNLLLGDFGDLSRLGAPTGFFKPKQIEGPGIDVGTAGTNDAHGGNPFAAPPAVAHGSISEGRSRETEKFKNRIGKLNEQMNHFYDLHDYNSAAAMADRVLIADPLNREATQMKANAEAQGGKAEPNFKSSNSNGELASNNSVRVAPLIQYPADWDKIVTRSASGGIEKNANSATAEVEFSPPVYETQIKRVCVSPASCTTEKVPAVYKDETYQVCIKPESVTKETRPDGSVIEITVPAVYETRTRKVVDKPESSLRAGVEAVYKDVPCQVLVKPQTLNFNSPATEERYLRSYDFLKQENPKLAFAQFIRHPDFVHPLPLNDEGLGKDAYVEKYSIWPFIDCARDNLSTFGMDVDTASYTLARAALRSDKLPAPESIHTEEFLNYFKQDYKVEGTDAFGVFAEAAPSPFNDAAALDRETLVALGEADILPREILKIGIKSRDPRPNERKPCTLTFVIDTSGSMSQAASQGTTVTRLQLIQQALAPVIAGLNPEDAVSIVGFNTQAELALPRTQASEKQRILDALDSLTSHGETNVEAGLMLGLRMADEAFATNAVNRIVLCSDGVANVGQQGPDEIVKLVKIFAARGIELSTVGVGLGKIGDPMLRKLADEGNGSCHYADTVDEAHKIFNEKLPPHLSILARDAKVQVEFNADTIKTYRLIGYEKRKIKDTDFRNDAVTAGEVAHSTLVTVLYEIVRNPGRHGRLGKVYLRWKDAGSPRLDVVERNFPLEEGIVVSDVAKASPELRFLACVGRFAELLRHSRWTRQSSYAEVLSALETLPAAFKSKTEWTEVQELVTRAQRLTCAQWRENLK